MKYLQIIFVLMMILAASWLTAETKQEPKPLVTFLELGSANCIPCKMMKPVMKDVEEHYGAVVKVIFHDIALPKNRFIASQYKIRVMPTQVFLDAEGKEFFRHEGFYPKDELIKMLDKHLASLKKE